VDRTVADETGHNWRRVLRSRISVAATALVLWAAAIEARLVYLQVAQHDELLSRGSRQQRRTIPAPAKRGEILDRNGRVLAYSVDADSVYAVPSEISDAQGVAAQICDALQDCSFEERQTLTERLGRSGAFAYMRRRVTPEQARRVATLQLDGVGFMSESRRFYPNRDLAAHVLGYTGLDGDGLSGLEATYDDLIKGRKGTVLVQVDARRKAFSRLERPPTTGASLELTIDQYLQHVTERELRVAAEARRAAGGTAIVMDPSTGEILALANWPTFNPNAYRDANASQRRNRAVQDIYEPGSTFKIVTAGAALGEGVVRPEDLIDVTSGKIRFGSRVIGDDHEYGILSFTDVIVKSSNVGAIKVGLRLGPERMGKYVSGFGFGRRSSPDFPAESPGIVWNPAKINDSALASIAMGHQVAVTALQMAAAVSAVASGGELMEPRIVRAVIRDGVRALVPRKVTGRALTRQTAAELTAIMESVVERGTGTRAQVAGFTVAGKTGTAQKLVDGQYSHSLFNSSFVGFVPSRNPEFAIVVVLDSPNDHYGGLAAAPVFQAIATAALRRNGVAPTIHPPAPFLVARDTEPAGPAIVAVRSEAGGDVSLLPDLRELSARDAMQAVVRLGMTVRLRGEGHVVDQRPDPGTALEPGGTTTLWLERAPVASNGRQP
jgi:cell division protein FtsI (penicillin-binding protein 3)